MPVTVADETGLATHDMALSGLLESLFTEQPLGDHVRVDPPQDNVQTPASADLFAGPDDQSNIEDASDVPVSVEQVPAWAQSAFRALLFRVGRFRFAMPLVLMRSIFLWPDQVARVPGQPDWHRGLVRYRGASVIATDLGLLLGVQARCEAARYLLLIGDGHAALECDAIDDAVVLEPGGIRWAENTTRRPWLAGLIPDQMCGLLDANAINEQIRHG